MCPASIHVQHMESRYIVARGLKDAAAVQRRLDRIALEPLTRSLEQRFAALPDHDRALYFIEQLNVECRLDFNHEDHLLASEWAAALHEDVLRTLSRGGSGLIVFRDRGEYLASFLEDLLRGRAWTRWYYGEFAHLTAHATGQAITRALVADGDDGRDALLLLAGRGALDLLLSALDDSECDEIVAGCLLPTGYNSLTETLGVWTQALRVQLSGLSLTSSLSRDVARLYLSVLRDRPELGPDVNLACFIRDLLKLRQTLAGMDGGASVLAQIKAEQWDGLLLHLGQSREQGLLLSLMRELGGRETASLLRDLQGGGAQSVTRRVLTNYGGIFLLAATMAELRLNDFLRACPYPEPEGIEKDKLLRFLIGLQCLGLSNAQRARKDAGLLLFAGLNAAPAPRLLKQYAETLTPEMHAEFSRAFQTFRQGATWRLTASPPAHSATARAAQDVEWCSLLETELSLPERALGDALSEASALVLRGFAAKLGAFAESSPAYLCRNFLECPAEVIETGESLAVNFLNCPLQMVLRMAGFSHQTWPIVWLEGRELEFNFD